MFRPGIKSAIKNKLAFKRRGNQSFSVSKNATANKKVKEDRTKEVESGYFKNTHRARDLSETEWSSCSSTEEMRNTAEETDFPTITDPLLQNLTSKNSHKFDIQSFAGEFAPKAESTPIRDLEIEDQLSNSPEEARKSGKQFRREKLTSITDDIKPIFLSEQYYIPDLIDNTSIRREGEEQKEICQVEFIEDQNLLLNEEYSASETLKNSDSSNRRISKTYLSMGSRKKNQSDQKSIFLKARSLTNNAKSTKTQSNCTKQNDKQEACQNISPISSKNAALEIAPKKLVFPDATNTELCVKDSTPRKKCTKKNINKTTQKSRTKDQSHQSTESKRKLKNQKNVKNEEENEVSSKISNPVNNCKTRKQRQSHLAAKYINAHIEESQNLCPTSSKDSGSVKNRRSFKTLGYCTQKKDEEMPICFITTIKSHFPNG